MEDYKTLKHELNSFKKGMFGRERIVILNKSNEFLKKQPNAASLLAQKEKMLLWLAPTERMGH